MNTPTDVAQCPTCSVLLTEDSRRARRGAAYPYEEYYCHLCDARFFQWKLLVSRDGEQYIPTLTLHGNKLQNSLKLTSFTYEVIAVSEREFDNLKADVHHRKYTPVEFMQFLFKLKTNKRTPS